MGWLWYDFACVENKYCSWKKKSDLVGAPTRWFHTEVEQIQYNMIRVVITMSCPFAQSIYLHLTMGPAHEHLSFSSMVGMWLTVPHWLALSAGTFPSSGALMWSKPMGGALFAEVYLPAFAWFPLAFGFAYFEGCFDAGTQAYSHTHSNVLQVNPKKYFCKRWIGKILVQKYRSKRGMRKLCSVHFSGCIPIFYMWPSG